MLECLIGLGHVATSVRGERRLLQKSIPELAERGRVIRQFRAIPP